MRIQRGNKKKGFVILTVAVAAFVLLGMCGMAFDIGRMFITRNEVQAYVDSAALSAAAKLNGSSSGITSANNAVTASVNKWKFNTQAFQNTVVEFSTDGQTGWDSSPASPGLYRYVRVTATAPNLALMFMPAVGAPSTITIGSYAIAGQVLQTSFSSTSTIGVFPFSPYAHADGATPAAVLANDPTGNFGFTAGQVYTLRWPSNPRLTGNNANVCAGDATNQWVTKADAASNSERGYIQATSASEIRAAIQDDQMVNGVTLGQALSMSGGAKGTEATALDNRVAQDTDSTSATYAAYLAAGNGNGRRVITTPINSGPRDNNGVARAAADQNIAVGFAQFFLPPGPYPNSGNKSWCVEYIGPAPLTSSSSNTGAGGTGQGAYVVRLVE